MIDLIEALVLGVVQGATEYLPISSSGHLVIAQHLFGWREPALLFDIVLHVATLVAVIWYYRKDIWAMARAVVEGFSERRRGRSWAEISRAHQELRLLMLIFVGSIPTAAIGGAFQGVFERLFASVSVVGVALMVTGAILLLTLLARPGGRGVEGMKVTEALLIGTIQGLAITPGISRSGSTIAVALLLGIERETAARYSFLLSVPSILGALLLKLGEAGGSLVGPLALSMGFLAALFTGYACLALLVRLVKRGRLAWFAPYCFVAGAVALFLAARSVA